MKELQGVNKLVYEHAVEFYVRIGEPTKLQHIVKETGLSYHVVLIAVTTLRAMGYFKEPIHKVIGACHPTGYKVVKDE